MPFYRLCIFLLCTSINGERPFKNVPFAVCDGEGDSSELVLKLTTCTDNMFTCDDGRCIDIEDRCNDKADCLDGSDEKKCKKISTGKKYLKGVAPFTMDKAGKNKIPVDVKISISVGNILRLVIFQNL